MPQGVNIQQPGATISYTFATGQTTDSRDVSNMGVPLTVTLKSADATRKIEFSTDGGVEYFQPVYDTTSATMLVVAALASISHIRVTGVATNTWTVR